eukprot:Polyplicarium_translucidae@DN3328_c2_g1_i5.p1
MLGPGGTRGPGRACDAQCLFCPRALGHGIWDHMIAEYDFDMARVRTGFAEFGDLERTRLINFLRRASGVGRSSPRSVRHLERRFPVARRWTTGCCGTSPRALGAPRAQTVKGGQRDLDRPPPVPVPVPVAVGVDTSPAAERTGIFPKDMRLYNGTTEDTLRGIDGPLVVSSEPPIVLFVSHGTDGCAAVLLCIRDGVARRMRPLDSPRSTS